MARKITRCTFCGKSHGEVRKLMAGPGVSICDNCVTHAESVLKKVVRPDHIPLCSFCGKKWHIEVRELFAGPGVYLCDNCLHLCRAVLDKELSTVDQKLHPPEIKEDRFATAGLAQIDHHISMLLQERDGISSLLILGHDLRFLVSLHRSRGEQTGMVILITKEAHHEQAVRAFFDHKGVKVRWQSPPSDSGVAHTSSLVYPLPFDTPSAVNLVTDLLRTVYRVDDKAGLCFRYTKNEAFYPPSVHKPVTP